jgi:hypothetical protein
MKMTLNEPTVPALSAEELDHLRAIRVCGCDGDCAFSNGCPTPVLDGIGADWIANHFDQILATIVARDATLTDVLSMSTCTKCGLRAVPIAYLAGGGSAPLRLAYYSCPRDGCGYLVSPPMSALIESLEARLLEVEVALTAIAGRSCQGGAHCSDAYGKKYEYLRTPCVHAIARAALRDAQESK